ncbi:aldolase-type TIM barrel family protein [Actinidia rufa]|uniref:Aldolase-type TIM barrel family protein n=1 Tax=Actinidia rufa TaxID=165716 RepID=A0A7J0FGM2_9ERIC|nr:aldolase-type TIM barrel family protein [Actinidia rufa]
MQEGKYTIVTDRWQKFTDVCLDQKILDFLALYADEFLVHGVDVEGKKLGIDEELVTLLGRHSPVCYGSARLEGSPPFSGQGPLWSCLGSVAMCWSPHPTPTVSIIPATYAGGVTVMSDLETIKVAGMERVDVTVGSALDIFGGNLAYKDVVAWHTQQEALAV